MSIGHKGMIYAAKVLAATMVDLFADPAKLAEVRREFEEKTRGVEYVSYLPDGPATAPRGLNRTVEESRLDADPEDGRRFHRQWIVGQHHEIGPAARPPAPLALVLPPPGGHNRVWILRLSIRDSRSSGCQPSTGSPLLFASRCRGIETEQRLARGPRNSRSRKRAVRRPPPGGPGRRPARWIRRPPGHPPSPARGRPAPRSRG